MQEKIINHFISLTKVPHCSQNLEPLEEYLTDFAKKRGYEVEVDSIKNILIKKGNPKLALQAHYDMVCMGKAPQIETYMEDGWLLAEKSSLGADNGIAIAMMMQLMDEGAEVEFLLTSDEEIGLVGASAIELPLSSSFMLNLDFEDEGVVCIGCAGGADLIGTRSFQEVEPYQYSYQLSVLNLDGGHSGVEIHKNIPNAIKVLANYLEGKEIRIAECNGGERRNSIPSNITMRISSKEPLIGNDKVNITEIDEVLPVYDGDAFIGILNSLQHGVYKFNSRFNLPDSSMNLARVHFLEGEVTIECSSRAMDDVGLEEINGEIADVFYRYDFELLVEYKYPAWKPEVNTFTALVNDAMEREFEESHYEAIHAGLECGVLLERYPDIKFASIGPTIVSPHSIHERVKLDSVEKIFRVVKEIITKL